MGSGYNSQDAAVARTAKAEWPIKTFTSGILVGAILATIGLYILIQANS
jgi:hypothetical protein